LVALCPFLVDEFVDNDARIRAEAERRFIVERHTERSDAEAVSGTQDLNRADVV
jgi:hypothetical protein